MSQFPLIKAVIPLTIGFLIRFTIPLSEADYSLDLFAWFAVLVLWLATIILPTHAKDLLPACLLISGWCLVGLKELKSDAAEAVHFPTPAYVVAIQEGYAKKTSGGWNVVFQTNGFLFQGRLIPVHEKWMVAVRGADSIGIPLEPGRKYLLNLKENEQTGPKFPGAFDWHVHLRKSGISKFGTVTMDRIHPISESNGFWHWAFIIRKHFSDLLNSQIEDPKVLGVAGALLLGNEEWLSDEIENSFAHAGVLHVLCVSGMHVVMVYGLLIKITSPLIQRKAKARHLLFPTIILTVWMYALVSGFGSSVIRAAAMASFTLLATWIGRPVHIKNLLSASVILVMLMYPHMLMEVGFQLSFLAVCGILFISPKLEQLFRPANRFQRLVWELCCVTLSAQIATFPLSLYLFGQFPNWFLPANMIIVPVSTMAMYLGIGLMAVGEWPVLANAILWIFENTLQALIQVVGFFGALPYAVTSDIHFTGMMCLGCYVLLILVYSETRKGRFINWIMRLLALHLIIASIIYRDRKVEDDQHAYLTSVDQRVILATVSNGTTTLSHLSHNVPEKSKRLASQIRTRTGSTVLLDSCTDHSNLTFIPEFKLMQVRKWSSGARLDGKGLQYAGETIILLVGDSLDAPGDLKLDQFPNLKTIIVSSTRMQRRIERMNATGSRGVELINLTKSGHWVLTSD